jgi:hypothetical protein
MGVRDKVPYLSVKNNNLLNYIIHHSHP